MRSTGIVRRIDDLGRVVIPKDIRKRLRIEEGQPMELYLNGNQIILEKYEDNDLISKIKDIVENLPTECVIQVQTTNEVIASNLMLGDMKPSREKKLKHEGESWILVAEEDNFNFVFELLNNIIKNNKV